MGGDRDSLDLTDAALHELLESATALAEQEIRAARDGPVFEQPPSAQRVARLLDGARELPLDGEPLEDVLRECAELLAAGRRTGPAFFGYVQSPPTPVAVAADLIASAADQNVTAWRSAPAATELEHVVLRWLGSFVGFAAEPAGVLVSGGSAANLTALLMALQSRAGPDPDRRRLTVHASEQAHFSIAKACGVLGVQLRTVPADGQRRLDAGALEAALAADRGAGLTPICVVATAGTVATGAVDPLDRLADLAASEEVWLHVDGAYGAPAAADPESRHLFAGLERADSLALDPHKWLYVPVDCGALLVRDPLAGPRAFGSRAGDYVQVLGQEATEAFAFWDHGLELSRRFRSLKVWMTLRHYGARRIATAIAEDIALAAYMAELVGAAPDLELLAPPGLSICCFRHAPAELPAAALDGHNQRLLDTLQRDGRAYLSNATLDGRFALRACITNFRTERADVERTLGIVRELGASLT